MPLSSEVRDRCRGFLPAGAELRYLFPALSLNPGMAPVLVAVTSRTVTVLTCSFLRRNRPTGVLVHYPRTIQLGPVDTRTTPTIEFGNLMLEIDDEYISVVRCADAEVDEQSFLPPDPLPDL
ncbi:hypothetical protein N8J89_08565 [Crossiella sp. CA-258035]|uniref:hypothetical protein n=1 Tax=Crossiella sp. CA-258035 TaxID=2981138 RepID=UPI0024BC567E|nr:hypothetical protein [Crossiella sp. CA-258035]WHT21103.1 hypothetical protein N8J89_08565 [Crossiella sp. CA-258035]